MLRDVFRVILPSMESNKVSNCNSKNRFADYFVICGLDYSSGLEPDTFAGNARVTDGV